MYIKKKLGSDKPQSGLTFISLYEMRGLGKEINLPNPILMHADKEVHELHEFHYFFWNFPFMMNQRHLSAQGRI